MGLDKLYFFVVNFLRGWVRSKVIFLTRRGGGGKAKSDFQGRGGEGGLAKK